MGSFPLYEGGLMQMSKPERKKMSNLPTSAIRQSGQESFNLNLLLCVMLGKIWSLHV